MKFPTFWISTLGTHHELCVLAVYFEEVGNYPGFNFKKAVDEGLWRQKNVRYSVWKES